MDLRMETSQAVSMLQPFRHPKPGLFIMNKEEKFKQNLPEFLYDDDGQIKIGRHGDTDVTNEWHEFLTKYAQQVSMRDCLKFAQHLNRKKSNVYNFVKYFNTWKSKQA